jgi:L-asparaginase
VTASPTRIAVFSLGGTIAMAPQPGGGVSPALSAKDLLAAVPNVAALGVKLEVHDFRCLPSASLDFDDLLALAAAIDQQVAAGVDGVVITQGTDTIEETSYLLDLVHDAPVPIVVTGAMRNATAAGADGPANLLAALRVAASPHARGLGCVVVFAEEIHAARYVRKTHATSITAFTSTPGPIGYVVEDQVRVLLRPQPGPLLTGVNLARQVRTGLVVACFGQPSDVLAVLAEHVDGLVIAGFGAGHVPESWVPALVDLAARKPVVLTSRTGAGSVLSATYGFPGSEFDLLSKGLLSAGSLDPFKARILLHLSLLADADHAAIAQHLALAGHAHPPAV